MKTTRTLLALAVASVVAPFASAEGLEVKIERAKIVTRHAFPGGWAVAPRGYKLLVLDYVVRNTSEEPVEYSQANLKFSVKQDGTLYAPNAAPLRMAAHMRSELADRASLRDQTWIEVPNDYLPGVVEVRFAEDEFALDIKDRTKIEPDGFLGQNGHSVDAVLSKVGQWTPLGAWNVQFAGKTETRKKPHPFLAVAPAEKFVVATVRLKSGVGGEMNYDGETLRAYLPEVDGGRGVYARMTLGEGKQEATGTVGGRKTAVVRFVFVVPKDLVVKRLRLQDPTGGRELDVDL